MQMEISGGMIADLHQSLDRVQAAVEPGCQNDAPAQALKSRVN